MFAEDLLHRAGCSPDIIAHCLSVSRTADAIAGRVRIALDRELISLGSMVHDIGRSRTQGIDHAVAGVEVARSLGLKGPVLSIIERHIGAGITSVEARRLGLPVKDYLPLTPEEKIVSYADNLVMGSTVVEYERALERFRGMLGPDHEGVGLFVAQHQEILGWMR
ncbi:MAG: hypothetical protein A2X56_06820 [Nitrospirae bacterium GWC2_57_13]|jgi:uncharacterized protein|nr:MAG: hypothetical protein A2X56_06820 [Nitrospirae bacterium GWC2_57_13]